MTGKHEIDDIKKQIELFDKLITRPLWKDVIVIFMFNVIVLGLTLYLTSYKDVDFDMSAFVVRLLLYVVVGTLILVPVMRKLNQMSLQKLRSKLKEHETPKRKK